jgi:hypothetical protein
MQRSTLYRKTSIGFEICQDHSGESIQIIDSQRCVTLACCSISITDHRPITYGSCLSHRDVHPVQYSLRYNVMPYVGMLSYGEAARTLEPINFPEARDSVS